MQITIEVPDRLGEQLQRLGDRLPEALALAVQELGMKIELLENLSGFLIKAVKVIKHGGS